MLRRLGRFCAYTALPGKALGRGRGRGRGGGAALSSKTGMIASGRSDTACGGYFKA